MSIWMWSLHAARWLPSRMVQIKNKSGTKLLAFLPHHTLKNNKFEDFGHFSMIVPKSWDNFGQNTSTNGSQMTESGLHQSVDLKISRTFWSKVLLANGSWQKTETEKQPTTRARGLKKCVTFLINFTPSTAGSLYSYKTSLTSNSGCTVQQSPYTNALLFNSSETFRNFLSIHRKLSKH